MHTVNGVFTSKRLAEALDCTYRLLDDACCSPLKLPQDMRPQSKDLAARCCLQLGSILQLGATAIIAEAGGAPLVLFPSITTIQAA